MIPVSDEDSNDPHNLAALCHACHLDTHGGTMLSHDVVYDSREAFWGWTQ
ncbi:HNH endonuclease [Halocatena salina]